MINDNIRNGLQINTTALLRQRNPASGSTTTSMTRAFRFPIHVRQLAIEELPTDGSGTVLPFVVLYDVTHDKVFATWSDVRQNRSPDSPVPREVDVSQTWMIATRSEADWNAVRQSLSLGGNGEPGTATNGGSVA